MYLLCSRRTRVVLPGENRGSRRGCRSLGVESDGAGALRALSSFYPPSTLSIGEFTTERWGACWFGGCLSRTSGRGGLLDWGGGGRALVRYRERKYVCIVQSTDPRGLARGYISWYGGFEPGPARFFPFLGGACHLFCSACLGFSRTGPCGFSRCNLAIDVMGKE